ncbi:DUF427 domain-containing protein [Streptomyces sp. NBC_00365]|uniref:DUF427 domain-containing protein n=1 Tax=Streptomyces sp. NBC_00365 TaxID=2975726 RepID=UPI0022597705|nr:DUF427 domain-containing protein [Streptomyces sp. NBC_00365]MCX5087833.1 DUF427 domain-containing protein [Streptomyces sp. NBC_00365]
MTVQDVADRRTQPTYGRGVGYGPGYKGLASYYDIGEAKKAAWSYREAYTKVGRVDDLVSFEPDKVEVYLDGERLHLEPGQQVVPHGVDRGLGTDEVLSR